MRAALLRRQRPGAVADHLAWHTAHTGRLDAGEARWYFAGERPSPFLLHHWLVIGLLTLAGAGFPPLRRVAGGLALHAATDMIKAWAGPW